MTSANLSIAMRNPDSVEVDFSRDVLFATDAFEDTLSDVTVEVLDVVGVVAIATEEVVVAVEAVGPVPDGGFTALLDVAPLSEPLLGDVPLAVEDVALGFCVG